MVLPKSLAAEPGSPPVAIVDYGMGNLFSVQRACEHAGWGAMITASPSDLLTAQAVILPGVGAFGDAMAALRQLGLAEALRAVAASGKPLMGVCLGMQLLMTRSYEFGCHDGLGIIEGDVVRLQEPRQDRAILKVPQVGWNRIVAASPHAWSATPLEGLADGTWMYFVHSFYAVPVDASVVCATTRYGHLTFCSSLRRKNVFACQFHPERSGPEGLAIYRNFFLAMAAARAEEVHHG